VNVGSGNNDKHLIAQVAQRPVASRDTATTGGHVSRFWVPVAGRVNPARRQPSGQATTVVQQDGSTAQITRSGPTVRITRGQNVTEVTVGGR
jgi:pilus assembly protein CpaB